MSQFFPISDKLLQAVNAKGRKSKYPWHSCPMGQSFTVPKKDVKLKSLESMAYKCGKTVKCRFVVYEHETCYEVAKMTIDLPSAADTGALKPLWNALVAQEPVERTSEAPRASAPWAPFDKD